MQLKHLDHLNLSVSSFDETASWYKRVFGFEIVESGLWRDKPWGVLKSGDAMLCVYEDPGRKFIDGDALRTSRVHGFNHFALRITDRSEWLHTIKRENISLNYGEQVSWPHSTSWYVSDPTGYEIEVVAWEGDSISFER